MVIQIIAFKYIVKCNFTSVINVHVSIKVFKTYQSLYVESWGLECKDQENSAMETEGGKRVEGQS
jgi:hypothetical protein